MALIQIRDVPEETYETIRRRARAAGQSIQAYMRQQVIDLASRPTVQEVLEELEADLATRPPLVIDRRQLLADIRSGRP
jgi:hypothetical protein